MAKDTTSSQVEFRVFPVVPGTLAAVVHTLVWVAVWNIGNRCHVVDFAVCQQAG